jgi:hypothetical protein
MEIQEDFKELLILFNENNVEYVIVGSYALAFHGAPRYTGDIDIFVRSSSENAGKIIAVLNDFGFASLGLKSSDFQQPDQVIQLGVPPVRIDLITSITAVSWEEAIDGSEQGKYGDTQVRYLGKKEYVKNKKAIGRKKDLADLEAIGE